MLNSLPKKIKKRESGIINLDDELGEGTHWVSYVKKDENIVYFDSYGNLRPPLEVIKYFLSDGSRNNITYNYDRLQNYSSYNCGHLVLKFLYSSMQ